MTPLSPSVPAALVVMGVSASGKSTVGSLLARRLGWPFHDGDDFHPPANIALMAAGVPLTDADREPWLWTLRSLIEHSLARGESLVLTCSALKSSYRAILQVDDRVRFIYLKGSPRVIAERTNARTDHFMPPSLLASQFAALEEPIDAMVVAVDDPPHAIVERILNRLSGSSANRLLQ